MSNQQSYEFCPYQNLQSLPFCSDSRVSPKMNQRYIIILAMFGSLSGFFTLLCITLTQSSSSEPGSPCIASWTRVQSKVVAEKIFFKVCKREDSSLTTTSRQCKRGLWNRRWDVVRCEILIRAHWDRARARYLEMPVWSFLRSRCVLDELSAKMNDSGTLGWMGWANLAIRPRIYVVRTNQVVILGI